MTDIESRNLTACRDCGTRVSRLAASCPKCGRPFKRRETLGSLLTFALRTIVVVLLVGIVVVFARPWILMWSEDRGTHRPVAELAVPAPVVPEPTAPEPHFSILDWRVIPATDVSKPKLVGELRNDGGMPMGPHLQVTVRGPDRRVSGVIDFWPASVSDIAPGRTFTFSYFLDSGPDDSVELKVIGGRTWNP